MMEDRSIKQSQKKLPDTLAMLSSSLHLARVRRIKDKRDIHFIKVDTQNIFEEQFTPWGRGRKSGGGKSQCSCLSVLDTFQCSYKIHKDKKKFGTSDLNSAFFFMLQLLLIPQGHEIQENQHLKNKNKTKIKIIGSMQ